ncbi:MAG: winged helix DNA-binding protein [Thermostichus sp. BF3_bins_97]
MIFRPIPEQRRTLGALLRLPYEALSRRVYARLAEAGFTDIRPAHSNVFRYLSPQGSRITQLAERAQITKQSMAYLVDSLIEGGYLKAETDPTDGRAKLLRLTAKGEAVQDSLLKIGAEVEVETAQLLGSEKLTQLRSLLEEWVELLKEDVEET